MSQHEKKEITSEQENSVMLEIKTSCDGRCNICNSDHLLTIHELKKAGNILDNIVIIMRDKYNCAVSKASLSRHFSNYEKHKRTLSAQIINNDLIEQATKQAVHTKKLVELIDGAFEILKARMQANTLHFDVSDLDKLMKLRYQILSGQDTDEKDFLAIFQKASNKYGLNLQQGVLFK